MPLEQTLEEVEPILRGTDETSQFTHPSFQEVLTAKQFAEEINSGALPVRDLCRLCWTYDIHTLYWGTSEDAPTEDIEVRELSPVWRNSLLLLAGFLPENGNQSYASDFIGEMVTAYLDSRSEYMLPLSGFMDFVADCSNRARGLNEQAELKIWELVENLYIADLHILHIPDCDEHWQDSYKEIDHMDINFAQVLIRWLNTPYMADKALDIINSARNTDIANRFADSNEALRYIDAHLHLIPTEYRIKVKDS